LVVRAEPPRGALSLALTHSDPPRGEILRGAMSQKNVEIVRRLYEGVPAPLETPQELFEPDFELDQTDVPLDAIDIVRGLEAALESMREYWDTFADFHIELKEVLHADEEHVVTAVRDGGQIRGSDAEVWNASSTPGPSVMARSFASRYTRTRTEPSKPPGSRSR
jgi:hypothetical protein